MLGRVARLVGINHVALEVGDLDEALEFYGRLFEFELRGRVPGMAFLDMGDQFLALVGGPRGRPPTRTGTSGSSWTTARRSRRAVEEAGAEIVPTRGLRFRDPWGNNVEVVEYGDIQFTKARRCSTGMGLDGLEKSDAGARAAAREGPGLAPLERLRGVLERGLHHRPRLADRLRVAGEVHDQRAAADARHPAREDPERRVLRATPLGSPPRSRAPRARSRRAWPRGSRRRRSARCRRW